MCHDLGGLPVLKTALFWLSQGIAVVPLYQKSKVPAVAWGQYREHLPTQDMAREWFSQPRNLALVTGWQNLCVLDFDTPEAYASFFVWHLERDSSILNTYRVQSNRGIHVYYYLSSPLEAKGLEGAAFEIKTAGRLVTASPSVHESGRRYTALDDPSNIRTVSPSQILNYSPVKLKSNYIYNITPSSLNPITTIDELKKSVSILNFFESPRQRQGQYYIANCPFHGHKNNFWIDAERNIGGCWAGCGNFDVISLYARLNNVSNGEAIKLLRRGYL